MNGEMRLYMPNFNNHFIHVCLCVHVCVCLRVYVCVRVYMCAHMLFNKIQSLTNIFIKHKQ
jgi:hypothetical protein